MVQADRLVGGPDAVPIVHDTALPKKGTASVGVAPQYATVLGKDANYQTLVSLTLAPGEVPVPVALKLFFPKRWTVDGARIEKAGLPPRGVAPSAPSLRPPRRRSTASRPRVCGLGAFWRMRAMTGALRSVRL